MLVIKSRLFEWVEERRVRASYYGNQYFKKRDKALRRAYRFTNPYRIARKHGQVYGETPLTTLEKIGKALCLGPEDRVVDMGCGRGRGVAFLRAFFQCDVIGIETIPEFAERSSDVTLGDMFSFDYSDVTHVYLYGTCLSDEEIARLSFPDHVIVVSVSYPLPGYKYTSFEGLFPWGKAGIYINYEPTHTKVRSMHNRSATT